MPSRSALISVAVLSCTEAGLESLIPNGGFRDCSGNALQNTRASAPDPKGPGTKGPVRQF